MKKVSSNSVLKISPINGKIWPLKNVVLEWMETRCWENNEVLIKDISWRDVVQRKKKRLLDLGWKHFYKYVANKRG